MRLRPILFAAGCVVLLSADICNSHQRCQTTGPCGEFSYSLLIVTPGVNVSHGEAGKPLTAPVSFTYYKVDVESDNSGTRRDSVTMAGVVVEFTVTSGGGTTSTSRSSTNAGGVATVEWTLGSVVGEQRLQAKVSNAGNPESIAEYSVTAVPAGPTDFRIVSGDYQLSVQGAVAEDLVVQYRRNTGSGFVGVPGIQVEWVLQGRGALSSTSTVTDANGETRVHWSIDYILGGGPGSVHTVTATKAPVIGALERVTFHATNLGAPLQYVFDDAFEGPDQWEVLLNLSSPDNGWGVVVDPSVPGGNPNGYRRMQHVMSKTTFPDFMSVNAIHTFGGSITISEASTVVVPTNGYYDPKALGAVNTITFSEDRISPSGLAVGENVFIVQGTRYYTPSLTGGVITNSTWARASRTITAAEAAAGGIDFSANGKPMRFGFMRSTSERFPQVREHGIDNFRVVLRRF